MAELRQRQPREYDEAFLAFLRRQRCCACQAPPPVQAAHLRIGSLKHDKPMTGIAQKPHDRWANPLCADCHLDGPQAQHKIGEKIFWKLAGVDPFANAIALYAQFKAQLPTPHVGATVVGIGSEPMIVAAVSGRNQSRATRLKHDVDSAPKTKVFDREVFAKLLRPKQKIQSRGFPPKGSRKFRSAR